MLGDTTRTNPALKSSHNQNKNFKQIQKKCFVLDECFLEKHNKSLVNIAQRTILQKTTMLTAVQIFF